uniref:Zgc:63863 n=1 Tax=Oncorhynchus tshawytscha TaxID=74940 RepID=A0AAZ3RPI7_ONCTS
ALNSDPVDIETLRRAAISEGGLLTDEIRREVWPKLLSVNFCSLLLSSGMCVDEKHVLQEQLIDSILIVLQKNPALHYYQGYHDIVVTFLLVVGERMDIAMVRDFMDPTMDSTKHILNYLMPILDGVTTSADVGSSPSGSSHGHILSEIRHVLRLYDFFLASHPLMAVYFAAVIVLHGEKEVKQTEGNMAMVYHILSQIPQDLPYEELITQAHCLFTLYPPSLLAKRARGDQQKSEKAFQMTTQQQRPDSVLRRQLLRGPAQGRGGPDAQMAQPSDTQPKQAANQLIKMAVWGISATLGAAALAVAQTALDWAPDFFMQLY